MDAPLRIACTKILPKEGREEGLTGSRKIFLIYLPDIQFFILGLSKVENVFCAPLTTELAEVLQRPSKQTRPKYSG